MPVLQLQELMELVFLFKGHHVVI